MADSTSTPNQMPPQAVRRYRRRSDTARDHRLTPRFTDEELTAIRAAAEAAQMTLTGFCASAALAAARRQAGDLPPETDLPEIDADEMAEIQRELFAARASVNRAGTNLNQAVAQLNATGQAPVWLEHAVARLVRAVEELDAVVSRIHHRLA